MIRHFLCNPKKDDEIQALNCMPLLTGWEKIKIIYMTCGHHSFFAASGALSHLQLMEASSPELVRGAVGETWIS